MTKEKAGATNIQKKASQKARKKMGKPLEKSDQMRYTKQAMRP